MEIRTEAIGPERKRLVGILSELVGSPAEYQGVPSFAYKVGELLVDKEGTIHSDENLQLLMFQLAERGFRVDGLELIAIEMPREGFTDETLENLDKLVASKASLIKKAIGADKLPIIRTEDAIKFPWFKSGTKEELEAYLFLIQGLCGIAKKRKRITAKDRPVPNEKFTFRVFLVQLGFVGDEYKSARKILLKNLTGNSAFKGGAPAKTKVDGDE